MHNGLSPVRILQVMKSWCVRLNINYIHVPYSEACYTVLACIVISGDASVQLSKYLLHTLCADLINMVLAYLAEDGGQSVPTEEEMNFKVRGQLKISIVLLSKHHRMWIYSSQRCIVPLFSACAFISQEEKFP